MVNDYILNGEWCIWYLNIENFAYLLHARRMYRKSTGLNECTKRQKEIQTRLSRFIVVVAVYSVLYTYSTCCSL